MNKKISIGVCISLIVIACTVTFVVTWTVSFNMYNNMIPGAVQRNEISSKLNEIDSFVQNNYYSKFDADAVAYGIFSGYISAIGDKNTVYMTAEEHTRFLNEESGQLITCGVIAQKEESGYITVTGTYPGSNADSSGIQKNDIITAVDGVSVLELGADIALKKLEGEENTRVTLTIQRAGESADHSLVRKAIDIVSVESAVIENIGFIRITAFNNLTVSQFDAALRTFSEASPKIRAIVFDVREASDSIYAPVPDMVNRLVKSQGVAAHTESKGGVMREFIVIDDALALDSTVPIIILADSKTSGASELVTAILKIYYSNVHIVGGITAGNATIQQTQGLKDGSAIRVTTARIVLTSDSVYADYEGKGIEPDYEVKMNGEVDYKLENLDISNISFDPQMEKAVEIIDTITTIE